MTIVLGFAAEHVFAIYANAVDQQQAPFDEHCWFPLTGLATVLISHIALVQMGVDVTHTERDDDFALLLNVHHQLLDHFNGFATADPKVEIGVVGLISIAAQGGNRASEEGLCLAASTFGFNPAHTVQVADTVDVEVEVVGLGGSGHGDLQKNGLEKHAPTHWPRGHGQGSAFPVRVAKLQSTLTLTLGVRACAFQELRRCCGAYRRFTIDKLSTFFSSVKSSSS